MNLHDDPKKREAASNLHDDPGAPVLAVQNLSVRHKGAPSPVINGISFSVAAGETLAIVGESGAGKSTIALTLMGLARAAVATGRMLFRGVDLLDADESDLCQLRGAGIGMIFQDAVASLDPAMPVEQQVAEAICLHTGASRGEARRQARCRLEAVGLDAAILARSPYAHQLSGGLCQRAMIAIALACSPRLLIADEPTSSLDVTTQAQIVSLLKDVQRESGLAIIFISHDLALVAGIADRIAVLHGGELVEQGSPLQIVSRPRNDYTQRLVLAWRNGMKRTDVAPA